jgi:hypothetical protein
LLQKLSVLFVFFPHGLLVNSKPASSCFRLSTKLAKNQKQITNHFARFANQNQAVFLTGYEFLGFKLIS